MRPRVAVGPAVVQRVEPVDGDRGVLCDTPVVLHLSYPVDPASLRTGTLEVHDGDGAVPVRREAIGGGRVLVLWPERRLRPGVEHVVDAQGLRDRLGREVAPHRSRFTPGPLGREEITM